MTLDALRQSYGDKQYQNLDPKYDGDNCSQQALVLLDPARDSPQATSQEDHALSSKFIQ